MWRFVIFLCLITYSFAAKEDLFDWAGVFDNPKLLSQLEKRLGKLLDEADVKQDDGCYSEAGTIDENCSFHANMSRIIKTTESMEKGASFLNNVNNISCARDCTELCCNTENCDTAIFQDKGKHTCYMFTCGVPSKCIFAAHGDYIVSSTSKATHATHIGGSDSGTQSHEEELNNLGDSGEPWLPPVTQTPSLAPSTQKPGLGEPCMSQGADCEDPHGYCHLGKCQCHLGYKEKLGKCRKKCTDTEFQCVNEVEREETTDCIPSSYVCDDSPDCSDGSDEMNCSPDKQDFQTDKQYTKKPEPKDVSSLLSVVSGSPRIPDIKPQEPSEQTDTQQSPETHPDLGTPDEGNHDSSSSSIDTNTDTVIDTVHDKTIVSGEMGTEDDKSKSPPVDEKNKESLLSDKTDTANTKAPTGSDKSTDLKNAPQKEDLSPTESSQSDDSNSKILEHSGGLIGETVSKVETSTVDSTQGPIVALALGLGITLVLLIFVGCRLRTVKRRLRKGRALHSNEADYLINGMYL